MAKLIAPVRAVAAGGVLLLLVHGLGGCAPVRAPAEETTAVPQTLPATSPPGGRGAVGPGCAAPGWQAAAAANGQSLTTLGWAPFGRPETGWEVYVPLIQAEIGAACAPDTEGFAAALASWQSAQGLPADGRLDEEDLAAMKTGVQERRGFVRFIADRGCPGPSDVIAEALPEEGYGGKQVFLRPGALRAYRQMAAAAKAEVPEIAADPRNLAIFSGYRSPTLDAQRCEVEGNCNGVARARCSAHRTGLALDLYVGQAEGYAPDSTADPNRLHMSRTATYRWLVTNARRFGFVNYAFEPWHWEWTGEAPGP